MNLAEAAIATRGRLVRGTAQQGVESVCTDSRNLRRGDFFVALRGPNFDGHDFIDEAVRAGAGAVLYEQGTRSPSGDAACIEVADTLQALGDLAAAHRRQFECPVVAITGSNGKTTTKEMLRAIMSGAWGVERVLANEGNLNNLIGMPMTLLRLTADQRLAILEMGMNAAGEIARLTEIAEPTHGLITCIGEAHLEGLGSLDGVATAKGELFRGLKPGATAMVNLDDARVVQQASAFAGNKITFGDAGTLRAVGVRVNGFSSVSFDIVTDTASAAVDLPLAGRHNVSNALGAAAVAVSLGVELQQVAAGLRAIVPPSMRLQAHHLANGVVVINDAYNANPSSLSAALECLQECPQERRLIVLGEMLELGEESEQRHRRAGAAAAAAHPALLCAMGRYAGFVRDGAVGAGLAAGAVLIAESHHDAATAVARRWKRGDAVLVKGSRGSEMEKVVSALEELAG